jgi:hypothetical protein
MVDVSAKRPALRIAVAQSVIHLPDPIPLHFKGLPNFFHWSHPSIRVVYSHYQCRRRHTKRKGSRVCYCDRSWYVGSEENKLSHPILPSDW